MMKVCKCGSRRLPYKLVDARGIFCAYVCEACEAEVRKRYRSDIFTDFNYWHDEPIDEGEPDFCSFDADVEAAAWAAEKYCANHPDRPSRINLDGDELCQECADAWVRAEGSSQEL